MNAREHFYTGEQYAADAATGGTPVGITTELALLSIAHFLAAIAATAGADADPASQIGRLMDDLTARQPNGTDDGAVLAPVLNIPPRFDRKNTSTPADAPAGADNGTTH